MFYGRGTGTGELIYAYLFTATGIVFKWYGRRLSGCSTHVSTAMGVVEYLMFIYNLRRAHGHL